MRVFMFVCLVLGFNCFGQSVESSEDSATLAAFATENPLFKGDDDACTGVYRYKKDAQWQDVTLYADGSCKMENQSGVAETKENCRYSQSGNSITFKSRGVSVTWKISSDCSELNANGVIHIRK